MMLSLIQKPIKPYCHIAILLNMTCIKNPTHPVFEATNKSPEIMMMMVMMMTPQIKIPPNV